jgi:hypothetical protein
MTWEITGGSMLNIFVYHHKFAIRFTLCSLTYLSTIQMTLFIRFRVNTYYSN